MFIQKWDQSLCSWENSFVVVFELCPCGLLQRKHRCKIFSVLVLLLCQKEESLLYFQLCQIEAPESSEQVSQEIKNKQRKPKTKILFPLFPQHLKELLGTISYIKFNLRHIMPINSRIASYNREKTLCHTEENLASTRDNFLQTPSVIQLIRWTSSVCAPEQSCGKARRRKSS